MPTSIQDQIRAEAVKQGIPPALALAVAEQESSFNPLAQGPEITVGGKKIRAQGLFQLLPETAAMLKVDHADPAQNISGGVRYLRTLLDQHQGDLNKALSTYGGVVHDTEYVPSLLARVERYKALEAANSTVATSQAARTGGAGPAGAPMVGNLTNPTGRASGAGPGPAPGMLSPNPAVPGEGFVAGVVNSLDPRKPEGRRNLAGAAGEIGATMLAGVPVVGTGASIATRVALNTARVAVPAIGAAAGGAAAQAGEEQFGTQEPGTSVGEAALQQGAYSLGGQAFMWPIRRGYRAFKGTAIGQAAREGVKAGVDAARLQARATVDATRDFATAALADLRKRSAATLADIELDNGVAIESARSMMNQLVPNPGTAATAAAMREVFEGPTKVALDLAGERVAAAAVSGPVISLAPLKASLEKMTRTAKPSVLFPGVIPDAPITTGVLANLAADSAEKRAVRAGAGQMAVPQTRMTAEQFKTFVMQQEALPAEARAPLTVVLDQVRDFASNIGDPSLIAFKDAHALKRLLDERVSWDRPARAINEQLTKGIRQQLRQLMEIHEPYNAATAAYAQLSTLYRRGTGKKLAAAFRDNPDAAARLLNPNSPSSAAALRSLLVDQAAAGGDAAGGQAAWDMARSSFTYNTILKGGIENVGTKLAKLQADSPEFYKTVFGDPSGTEIAGNLQKIAAAYTQAQAEAKLRTGIAEEAGELALEGAELAGKRATRDATRVGREAVAASKATREKFEKSTLGKAATLEQQLGDVLHVAGGGLRTGWAVRSLLRLMQAPSSADLLQWVSYSPARTQMMVKILTSPVPDRAASGFLRAAVGGIAEAADTDVAPAPTAAAAK